MDEYEVRDKYGNKMGTFIPESNGCDGMAAILLIAVIALAPLALVVLFGPYISLLYLCAYVFKGEFEALFILVPLAVASIYQGNKLRQENTAFSWKLLFKLGWCCGWPACVGGLVWTLYGGAGEDIAMALTEACFLALVTALAPAEIILYNLYLTQQKCRGVVFKMRPGASLEEVRDLLTYKFQVKKYQVEWPSTVNGYCIRVRKDAGIVGKVLGLTCGITVEIVREGENLRVMFSEQEWIARVWAIAFMALTGILTFSAPNANEGVMAFSMLFMSVISSTLIFGAIRQFRLPGMVRKEITKGI